MDTPFSRRHFSFETTLAAAPERVFPLLCPVREYEWIPLWRCELLHTASGVAELGCVFRTEFPDSWGAEVWVVSRYEPCAHIAFVRTGRLRTMRYAISLWPRDGGTGILWHQEVTALCADGAELLEKADPEAFAVQMRELNGLLQHYLTTGTMYRAAAPALHPDMGGREK
jgi:hypothetical protein